MVVLCLVFAFDIRKGMKEIEKSIGEVLYMISMFIPVVILAMMMTYFQPYAFLCALIWVLILAIGNRILMLRGMNKDIDHETRTALSFFSMVFGLVFYILQAHVQGGDDYWFFCVFRSGSRGGSFKNKSYKYMERLKVEKAEKTYIHFVDILGRYTD